MKELTKKFIFQSIIVWSFMIIFDIINMIRYQTYLLGGLALIINVYLLVDAILALKKIKNFVIIDLSRRK